MGNLSWLSFYHREIARTWVGARGAVSVREPGPARAAGFDRPLHKVQIYYGEFEVAVISP